MVIHFLAAMKARSIYFLMGLVHGSELFVPSRHKQADLGIGIFRERIPIMESQNPVSNSQDQNM